MKTRIWNTFTSLESNFRQYSISFSDGFDYLEYSHLLNKINKTPEDNERIVELNKLMSRIRYRYLNFISIGQVPLRLHRDMNIEKESVIRPFTCCRILDSFIILNEACANVLMQFNLGKTAIHPLRFANDESGKLYYFINIIECRKYLIKEKCETGLLTTVKSITEGSQAFLHPRKHADRIISVSCKVSVNDVDLWHDPGLKYSIFMSDQLRKELESKGLSKDWCLKECKVINEKQN